MQALFISVVMDVYGYGESTMMKEKALTLKLFYGMTGQRK